MFATITTAIAIVFSAAMLMSGFAILIPAYAQGGSAQSQISYRTEYPRIDADSESAVVVQTEHHLYRPGDSVRIMGSVSEEMREETDSDRVTVKAMNADGSTAGEQQATIEGNGEYSTTISLNSDAKSGEYSVGSKIEVEASLLGLLSAEIVAKLESEEAAFVVAADSSFDVQAEGGEEFTIDIASNSNIDKVELNEEEKKVSFTAEGQTGTKGVAEVTVPKAMLSGEMMVVIDGRTVSSDSTDVIVKSNTEAEVTFEINYSHSERTVEVTGTSVVPEFPISALVMAAAIASTIVLTARATMGSKL